MGVITDIVSSGIGQSTDQLCAALATEFATVSNALDVAFPSVELLNQAMAASIPSFDVTQVNQAIDIVNNTQFPGLTEQASATVAGLPSPSGAGACAGFTDLVANAAASAVDLIVSQVPNLPDLPALEALSILPPDLILAAYEAANGSFDAAVNAAMAAIPGMSSLLKDMSNVSGLNDSLGIGDLFSKLQGLENCFNEMCGGSPGNFPISTDVINTFQMVPDGKPDFSNVAELTPGSDIDNAINELNNAFLAKKDALIPKNLPAPPIIVEIPPQFVPRGSLLS